MTGLDTSFDLSTSVTMVFRSDAPKPVKISAGKKFPETNMQNKEAAHAFCIRRKEKIKQMENYIIHITSGRGPAECCMAVALALKEVLKEAAEANIQTTLLERTPGMENRTLLSATLMLNGKNVKEFCHGWSGVLLWVCQSPFRKFHKRKNWFIGIQIFNQSNFAKWNEREIDFQTMRSGGPGGQNVNKVESAVRATHRPSGLMVMVNENRSQLLNKKLAIERLQKQFEEWIFKQALAEQQKLWQQHNTLERGNPSRMYEGLTFKKKLNNGK